MGLEEHLVIDASRFRVSPVMTTSISLHKSDAHTKDVGVFAKGEISLLDAWCTCLFVDLPFFTSTKVLYHTLFKKAIPKIKNISFSFNIFIAACGSVREVGSFKIIRIMIGICCTLIYSMATR